MIFDGLTLHNYCQYKGEHYIEFTPKDDRYCVTLIGGLNGAGKTTLLEALQVAFYGRKAPMAETSKGGYPSFLEERINRTVCPSEGASLELEFRVLEEGAYRTYVVTRTWAENQRGRIVENLSVSVDGEHDPHVTENWDEYAEWFIPSRLAPLFFFDGEKIEDLADPAKSKAALRTAVEALLGLDVITRLEADLQTLERRKLSQSSNDDDGLTAQIEEVEGELLKARKTVSQLTHERLQVEARYDRLEQDLKVVEHDLEQSGGKALENRQAIESSHAQVKGEIEAKEIELRELAGNALPLALLMSRLRGLKEGADKQLVQRNRESMRRYVQERDAQTVEFLGSRVDATAALVEELRHYLEEAYARDFEGEVTDDSASMPEGLRDKLGVLLEKLNDQSTKVRQVIEEHERLKTREMNVERQISMIPDEDSVASLIEKRADLKAQMSICHQEYNDLTAKIDSAANLVVDLERRLTNVYEKQLATLKEHDSTVRVIEYSRRAGDTLGVFKERLLARHAAKLSGLIHDCFSHLTHKQSLATAIEIDAKKFHLSLKDSEGQPLPATRLSAGERQLLAISILWGLARASGRPLPVIVDTPLGRLDGEHRMNICSKYFPFASHQVILLSTDEEIVGRLYDAVKPHLAHTYLLEFQEEEKQSNIWRAYFEDMEAVV